MSGDTVHQAGFVKLKTFNFLMYGAIGIYSTFFALYLKHIGLTTIEIGALLSGGPVVSLIANPIWAYWSDRLNNNRLILIIASIGAFAVMQGIFLIQSESLIYGAMLVFFIFQSPLFIQSNSLILSVIAGTGYKFGSFRQWGSLGWAVSAAAAGPVIGKIGIGQLWIIFDVVMILSILFAFTLPRGSGSRKQDTFSNAGYRRVFMNPQFLALLLIGILVSVPNIINQTFVGLHIKDLGGSDSAVGWSIFATAILEAPVFLLLDRYLKNDTKPMVVWMAVVSLLYSVRWLLMSLTDSPLGIIAIQLMHCVTFGAYYYIGTRLTTRLIPHEYLSTGQAVYGLSWSGASGIIAGTLGGWMFQELGTRTLYQISAGVTLLGMVAFLVMFKMIKTPSSSASAQAFSISED
ncbi:MFS transporter [Paenibacillus sp. J22TS3]|uniref:MFS transporter n=1 Tax=Paenibacillus sp. J22TS3 TaxID=2807192 RepID=UPI001B2553F3|nr:MFS transporter [Paenibacillus sp. J22TS3]GIP20793.1 MFS transporter [Paenibacillus sp. J22TS3]